MVRNSPFVKIKSFFAGVLVSLAKERLDFTSLREQGVYINEAKGKKDKE